MRLNRNGKVFLRNLSKPWRVRADGTVADGCLGTTTSFNGKGGSRRRKRASKLWTDRDIKDSHERSEPKISHNWTVAANVWKPIPIR